MSSLSEHGRQHLTEIESDLLQTNMLLKEAIIKLSASFMAIHEATQEQQVIVDHLLAEGANTQMAHSLRDASSKVALCVNAAITGLQFQDMTDQLIARTMQRVVGFRDVLEIFCTTGEDLGLQENEASMLAILDRMKTTLEQESVSLEQILRKAVRQTHMESGDIELF